MNVCYTHRFVCVISDVLLGGQRPRLDGNAGRVAEPRSRKVLIPNNVQDGGRKLVSRHKHEQEKRNERYFLCYAHCNLQLRIVR